MKSAAQKITLTAPVHKAAASESDLFDHHCVRVLPVPGGAENEAIACALNGRIIAVTLAQAERLCIIPSSVLPKTMSAPFVLDIKGTIQDHDEDATLVAGRTDNGKKDGLFIFESKGDAKLRVGVDLIRDTADRLMLGSGIKVTLDTGELHALATACCEAQSGGPPKVTLYIEQGKPVVVIGNAGVGIICHDPTQESETDVPGQFSRMADKVARAFARIPADAKKKVAKVLKRVKRADAAKEPQS